MLCHAMLCYAMLVAPVGRPGPGPPARRTPPSPCTGRLEKDKNTIYVIERNEMAQNIHEGICCAILEGEHYTIL